jgi:serine acetyltransferase
LSGGVSINDLCLVGTGTNIIPKCFITSNVIIGANSTVLKSISEIGKYVGNPIKKYKNIS